VANNHAGGKEAVGRVISGVCDCVYESVCVCLHS